MKVQLNNRGLNFILFPRAYIPLYDIRRNDKIKWILSSSQSQVDFNCMETTWYITLYVQRGSDRTQPLRVTNLCFIPKKIVKKVQIIKGEDLLLSYVSGNSKSDVEFIVGRVTNTEQKIKEKKAPITLDVDGKDKENPIEVIESPKEIPIEPKIESFMITKSTPEIKELNLEATYKSAGLDTSKSMFVPTKTPEAPQNKPIASKKFIIRGGKRIEVVQNIL